MFSRTSLHSAPPGTARRPHFRFSWWLATAHSEYLHPTYCRGKRSRRLRAAQSRKLAGAEADVLQPDQGQGLNPLLPRPSQRVRLDTEGGLPPAQATLPLEVMPQKPSNKFLFLLIQMSAASLGEPEQARLQMALPAAASRPSAELHIECKVRTAAPDLPLLPCSPPDLLPRCPPGPSRSLPSRTSFSTYKSTFERILPASYFQGVLFSGPVRAAWQPHELIRVSEPPNRDLCDGRAYTFFISVYPLPLPSYT